MYEILNFRNKNLETKKDKQVANELLCIVSLLLVKKLGK